MARERVQPSDNYRATMMDWLRPFAGLTLMALAACATAQAPRPPSPLAQCDDRCAALPADEPMLERVEGEDTRYFELPEAASCPFPQDDVPKFRPVDDSDVPDFDARRTRLTNMYSGEESLTDQVLLDHLQTATTQVFACLSVASCYDSSPLPRGEIDFAFEVEAAGRVRAVTVNASHELDRWGVVACARRAIFETEFPAYDGGQMMVSYRLEIE